MNTKTIAENRVVRHEYFIIESYEAGIELFGTEVKSIRNGGVNLKDSWISIENGEAFIRNMHISPYEKGNIFNKDPYRTRKLLMHEGDTQAVRSGKAGRLHACSGVHVLQGLPRQGAGRALQGQEAPRQARRYGKARRRPRDRTRYEGAQQVIPAPHRRSYQNRQGANPACLYSMR